MIQNNQNNFITLQSQGLLGDPVPVQLGIKTDADDVNILARVTSSQVDTLKLLCTRALIGCLPVQVYPTSPHHLFVSRDQL